MSEQTPLLENVTEHVRKQYQSVSSLQESDFISFDSLYNEIESVFAHKDLNKYDVNSMLMMEYLYTTVEGLGNVWLIKRVLY